MHSLKVIDNQLFIILNRDHRFLSASNRLIKSSKLGACGIPSAILPFPPLVVFGFGSVLSGFFVDNVFGGNLI